MFLDSIFVCLASISHQAKLKAKVVYISSVSQLSWVLENLLQTLQQITSPSSQPPPLSNSHTKPISLSPNHTGLGSTQLETSPIAHSLLTLFKPADPKLSALPCLPFPWKKIMVWAVLSPHGFCFLTKTGASPCGPAWRGVLLLLGNVSNNNLLSTALAALCCHSVTFIN